MNMEGKRKANRDKLLAVWLIIIPFFLSVVYFYAFAIDRYVTTALVVVRQTDSGTQQVVPGLATLLGASNSSSREDTLFLKEYIVSSDMFLHVQKALPWREHYADQGKDPVYWFAKDESLEDSVKYFQRMVKAHHDGATGLLSIEVEAFDPEFSRDIMQVILKQSDVFVNELSHDIAREQVRFAQSELANAKKEYENQNDLLLRFQAKNSLFDAQGSAELRSSVIGQLESAITQAQARLRALRSTLSESSTQVRQQRVLISSLEEQLQTERKSLVSLPDGQQLNVIAARFKNMQIDAQVAEEAYKLSITALDNARIEAIKRIRSLIKVSSPVVAESPLYPRRIYDLLTILIGLLIFYGLARFVIVSIEDHRD